MWQVGGDFCEKKDLADWPPGGFFDALKLDIEKDLKPF